MRVELPAKYAYIFKGVSPIFKSVETHGDVATVDLALGFGARRTALNLAPREFHELFDSIKVFEGKKLLNMAELILEPTKTSRLYFRIPSTELALVKKAAELRGETLTKYCIGTILEKTVEELESRMLEATQTRRNPR